LEKGRPGVLHGQMSYLLQDDDGQILEAHSISAGLDYPGIGPEHAFHKDNNSVSYDHVTDTEALDAFVWLSRAEGIIPAFESAHAIAYLKKMANIKDKLIIVNLSGRGDKDMMQAKQILNFDN
jgi:tryptophan synthase beta chain